MNHDKIPIYTDKELVKHDLTIWITVVIVSNLVLCNFKKKIPFDNDWLFYSIGSLLGLSIHSVATSKITLFIIKKLNIKDYRIKVALVDTIKWTTVFIFNNMLFTYLKHKEIIYNLEWFKLYGGIILGYILFNLLFVVKIYNLAKGNPIFGINIFKSSIGIFIGYYLTYGNIHLDFFHSSLSVVISFIIYYLIVQKFIPSILL
jgi:hypothetical protein